MNYKQKIPLLCFVVLTVIVALTMAVLDVQTYINYLDAKDAIKLYQDEIVANSKKTPSYNDENKKAIEKYSAALKGIIASYKLQYGKPHRKALIAFAAAVKDSIRIKKSAETEDQTIPEARLVKEFAEYYNALPDDKKGTFTDKKDKAIWEGFMKRLYSPSLNDRLFDLETMTYLDSGEKVSADDVIDHDPVAKKAAETEEDKEKIFKNFVARMQKDCKPRKEKVDQAFAKFADYSRQYAAYQVPGTQYKCFLDALGLPVTGEFSDLNDTLNNQKYWAEIIPGFKEIVSASSSDSKLDVEKILKTLIISQDLSSWNENQLALIYQQMQIKEDLYKRMNDAKITRVQSVLLDGTQQGSEGSMFGVMDAKAPKVDPLKGKSLMGGAFTAYTYKVNFSGTIGSIRKFMNNLNNAYRDCRIYNIRDVRLVRELNAEKIADILNQKDGSSIRDGQEVPDSYGKVVIGKDMNVDCELLIDYIIYVQDLLPRQQAAR